MPRSDRGLIIVAGLLAAGLVCQLPAGFSAGRPIVVSCGSPSRLIWSPGLPTFAIGVARARAVIGIVARRSGGQPVLAYSGNRRQARQGSTRRRCRLRKAHRSRRCCYRSDGLTSATQPPRVATSLDGSTTLRSGWPGPRGSITALSWREAGMANGGAALPAAMSVRQSLRQRLTVAADRQFPVKRSDAARPRRRGSF